MHELELRTPSAQRSVLPKSASKDYVFVSIVSLTPVLSINFTNFMPFNSTFVTAGFIFSHFPGAKNPVACFNTQNPDMSGSGNPTLDDL